MESQYSINDVRWWKSINCHFKKAGYDFPWEKTTISDVVAGSGTFLFYEFKCDFSITTHNFPSNSAPENYHFHFSIQRTNQCVKFLLSDAIRSVPVGGEFSTIPGVLRRGIILGLYTQSGPEGGIPEMDQIPRPLRRRSFHSFSPWKRKIIRLK